MNNWIMCYKKEPSSNDKPSTVQINKNNVTVISLYSNYIDIKLVGGESVQFYFSDWEIKF